MNHLFKTTVIAALTCGVALSASARAPDDVDDLVGARASDGERELQDRHYHHVKTDKGSDRAWSYWWNGRNDTCISVVTMNGRYDSITDSAPFDCNQSGGHDDDDHDKKVAAAAAAVAIIGAIALAHNKHDHHDGDHSEDSRHEAAFERGYRDGLYNHSFDNYDNEREYSDGYDKGVDERHSQSSYRYHNDRENQHGYSSRHEFDDLVGMYARSMDNELEDRGFRNVDGFKSGMTAYTIWYNRSSRQCLQVAVADGKIDSAVDIHSHAACH